MNFDLIFDQISSNFLNFIFQVFSIKPFLQKRGEKLFSSFLFLDLVPDVGIERLTVANSVKFYLLTTTTGF
jgi:hypothetical protein